jgi:hypothetical protein
LLGSTSPTLSEWAGLILKEMRAGVEDDPARKSVGINPTARWDETIKDDRDA